MSQLVALRFNLLVSYNNWRCFCCEVSGTNWNLEFIPHEFLQIFTISGNFRQIHSCNSRCVEISVQWAVSEKKIDKYPFKINVKLLLLLLLLLLLSSSSSSSSSSFPVIGLVACYGLPPSLLRSPFWPSSFGDVLKHTETVVSVTRSVPFDLYAAANFCGIVVGFLLGALF